MKRRRLRDLRIRSKLIFSHVFTGMLALLVVAGAMTVTSVRRTHEALDHELNTLAGAVGWNCAAALDFGDVVGARETMASLSVTPSIVAARLYDAAGAPFCTYSTSADGQVSEASLELPADFDPAWLADPEITHRILTFSHAGRQHVLRAMEQRQPAAHHVLLGVGERGHVAQHRRGDREVRMHHALGVAGGAAGVHEQRRLVLVDGDIGQRVGLACLGRRQRGAARASGGHGDDQRHTQLPQHLRQFRLGQQRLVHHHCRHLGMPQDLRDGRRVELDVAPALT